MGWLIKLILMKRIKDLLKNTIDLGVKITEEKRERIKVMDERVKFDYSYLEGNSDNIIYWFHGFMSDNTSFYNPSFFSTRGWISVHQKLEPKPHIFCISFDKSWLISSDNERERGEKEATVDYIMGIIAHLEAKHLPGIDRKFPKRIVAGTSMGGFNACKMWLHQPEFWDGCALHVPLAVPTGSDGGIAKLLVGGQFRDEEWVKENPLGQAAGLLTPLHPEVHIQYSKLDQFGFYEPDKQLANLFKSQGISVEEIDNDGDHAAMDSQRMANFILRIFHKP